MTRWMYCLRASMLVTLAATVPAAAQIYKYTDPSGRVQYADKPPDTGSPQRLPMAGNDQKAALEGEWIVVNTRRQGRLAEDMRIVGSVLTFHADRLTWGGTKEAPIAFTLRLHGGSPPGFEAARDARTGSRADRPLWFVYERQGEALRLAYTNDGRRLTTFAPDDTKQIEMTLLRKDSAAAKRVTRDACDVLRAAGGVAPLLVAEPVTMQKAPWWFNVCLAATKTLNASDEKAVWLGLTGGATRADLDAMRADILAGKFKGQAIYLPKERVAGDRPLHQGPREEPGLGEAAFSIRTDQLAIVFALKQGIIVQLTCDPLPPSSEMRALAQRVLAAIDAGAAVRTAGTIERPPDVAPERETGQGLRELQGVWQAVSMTFEGAPYVNPKQAGEKWSFRGSVLTIEKASGDAARYSVRSEPGSQPKAFHTTPIPPSTQPGGWMAYVREGDRLRIASFTAMDRPPSGFEQPKVWVVTLVAIESGAAAATRASACDVLRSAGVMELLGPDARIDTSRANAPATQCVMEQRFGIVALQLMAATPRSALDKQREKEEKDAPVRAARTVVLDEPELGPSAFSVRMGNSVVVWAHAGDTAIVMRVAVPDGERAKIIPFTKRVLAQL